jgi:predicted molibdopterin-dependent oxidoreductase YjgC
MGCNINVHIRKTVDQVVRFVARENTPVDDGWLCDYGRFNYDFINADRRLTQPQVRRGGQLVPVSWEEALTTVADRLGGLAREFGPAAVGGIGSPRLTNEELYLFQKVLRLGLGTLNVDYRVDGAGYVAPLEYDAATASIAALERAGAILLVDADPITETPVLDLRLKKAVANRVPLIVIGERPTDLTRLARHWLRPAPGQSGLVLAALLAAIVAEGKAIEGFVLPSANPSLDSLAETTGIPAATLSQAALLYAAAGPRRGAIIYRRDDTALPGGQALLDGLVALARATGSTSEEGLGLLGLVRDANEQGAIDMGLLPTHLPGQQPLADLAAREAIEGLWGDRLPTGAGLNGRQMLAAAASGELRGLYLLGGTPRGLARAADAFRAAIERVDFLVVQDIALSPEIAAQADVILPGAAFTEKEGTFTNLERRVQRLRLGMAAPGEARADWRILRDLGARLAGQTAFGHLTPRDTMAEITRAAPLYAGITYGRIGLKGLQWPTGLPAEGPPAMLLAASAAPQG